MNSLEDCYIWVIGASSGIGAALAMELSQRGARVILSARRQKDLEAVKEGLAGTEHMVYPLDVREINQIKSVIDDLKEKEVRLSSVIFMPAFYKPHSVGGHDIDIIDQMIAVNLTGAFNVVHCVKPWLLQQGYGQIVLCSSIAGYRGLPMGQPYCATKAGLISYAESLKIELEASNLDVKVISPGFVKSPLTDKNDFPMPFIIGVDIAAKVIADGLLKRGFEISFPKRMIFVMKVLRLMP